MIYLDMMLYSAGGIVGTMHHVYFSGEPAVHMALGAFFSAAEVIPLTFLTFEAWSFLQLGTRKQERSDGAIFPTSGPLCSLSSVGFWNFLGAGYLWLSNQSSDRVLLRNWHGPDCESWTCLNDGGLWDAGRSAWRFSVSAT